MSYDDRDRPRGDEPKQVSGLGVAALVLGILAALVSLVPLFGACLAIPLGGIGLILGGIGWATAGKKTGSGIPIAGTVLSIIAVGISLYWYFLVAAAVGDVAGKLKDLGDKVKQELTKDYEKALEQAKTGTPVSASDLIKDYEANAKDADDKYKGKLFIVEGKVSSTALSIYVSSNDAKAKTKIHVEGHGTDLNTYRKVKSGDTIKFGGTVDGKAGDTIKVKDAVIIP